MQPDALPSFLKNDATEKLGGLGRHYLHSFRGHPNKSFVLSTTKPPKRANALSKRDRLFMATSLFEIRATE